MKNDQPWDAEEEQTLLALKESGKHTWNQIAKQLGRSYKSVERKYQKLKKRGEYIPEIEEVEIDEVDEEVHKLFQPEFNKKKKSPPSWPDLLKLAVNTQKAFEEIEPSQDVVKVKLKGNPPPIVLYAGDFHLGSRATDYVRWLYEMVLLLKTTNTFLISLGDNRENMRSFRHLKAVISQVLPPELQARLIVSFVQEMVSKGKLLADIGGTHDLKFDERIAGEMLLKWLYQQEKIAFFENKGILEISVDFNGEEIIFPNLLFHQSRYSSFLSTLHSNRREYQLTFPGKVVAGAHNHYPGAEIYYHYGILEKMGYNIGGFSWNIKVGPFITDEDQFRDLSSFYHRTATFCPACVYTKQGIVLLPTLKDALAYRASLSTADNFIMDVIEGLDIGDEDKDKLLQTLKMR